MILPQDVYCIGRLGKPHGVKGEVSFLFTDDVFDRTDCDCLILSVDHILVPFFIEEYRFKGEQTALVKFCDIDTQQQAAGLTGCEVFFPRQEAGGEEGLPWAQTVGFDLYDNRTYKVAGRIAAIDDTTENVLFELADGQLVPAAPELVTGIDTRQRRVCMDIPDGLLG